MEERQTFAVAELHLQTVLSLQAAVERRRDGVGQQMAMAVPVQVVRQRAMAVQQVRCVAEERVEQQGARLVQVGTLGVRRPRACSELVERLVARQNPAQAAVVTTAAAAGGCPRQEGSPLGLVVAAMDCRLR